MKFAMFSVLVIALNVMSARAIAVDNPNIILPPTRGGPCGLNQVPIACTTGIPPSCQCGPGPKPRPVLPLPGCLCLDTTFSTPVCGTNGVTYGSSCRARCAKAIVDCDGSCPCRPSLPVPPPRFPNINFIECRDAGETAAVAAARAACSVVKSKCPVNRPVFSRAQSAGLASTASFITPQQLRRLIEKRIAEICNGLAERTCRDNAESKIEDADCRKLLQSGPAVSVSGCRSQADAKRIFQENVADVCKAEN